MPGRNIRFVLTCLLLFVVPGLSFAQISEFEPPVKLSKSVNSESEESLPLMSPDGNQMYFTRTLHRLNTGGENSGQDIWVCHKKEDGTWTKANNNFPEWNNRFNNSIIGISADGKTVYLLDSYQVDGKTKGLAFSRFVNGKWTKPEKIKIRGLELQGFIGFYMNNSYDVLLISMEGRDSMGEEDLYVSFIDESGKWSKPKSLGPTINSAGYEISPYLSPDKRTLYFASNGRIGYGDADIYMSQRLYDSWEVWSSPINLGPNINSENFDAYFTLKDSTAYFVSNRDGEMSDVYQSKIKAETVNYSQLEIEEILRQAQQILSDLGQDTSIIATEELIVENLSLNVKGNRHISFDFNSSSLNTKAQNQLEKVMEEIKDIDRYEIMLTAFSDDLSSASLNESLSLERAQRIKNYLTDKGLDSNSIITEVTRDKNIVSKGKSGVEVVVKYN